ncbi:high mobility group b protein 1 [Quercus suber]|uniref:High mobility group b protein 1 n=1 Tax=Quercus suber TaxID=58331 RepID=A0AAW0MAH5_QUESU
MKEITDRCAKLKLSLREDVEVAIHAPLTEEALVLIGILTLTMKIAKGKVSTRKDKKEVALPVEERKVGKRKAALKADKSRSKWTKKAKLGKKDPDKPKRPPSAFFVFLEEFRKTYKEEHPNVKAVSAVGKAGGEKWKSLTKAVSTRLFLLESAALTLHCRFHWIWLCTKHMFDDFGTLMAWPSQCQSGVDYRCPKHLEKAPYESKAAQRKVDYEKLIKAYNKKQESVVDDEDEESDKSNSVVNDEDDEETGEGEEDDDEDDD